jgi:hypothetical protein
LLTISGAVAGAVASPLLAALLPLLALLLLLRRRRLALLSAGRICGVCRSAAGSALRRACGAPQGGWRARRARCGAAPDACVGAACDGSAIGAFANPVVWPLKLHSTIDK